MHFSYRSRPQPRLPEVASHPITLLHAQEKNHVSYLLVGGMPAYPFFSPHNLFATSWNGGKHLRVAVLKLALPTSNKKGSLPALVFASRPGDCFCKKPSIARSYPMTPRTTPFWWRKGVPALYASTSLGCLCAYIFPNQSFAETCKATDLEWFGWWCLKFPTTKVSYVIVDSRYASFMYDETNMHIFTMGEGQEPWYATITFPFSKLSFWEAQQPLAVTE